MRRNARITNRADALRWCRTHKPIIVGGRDGYLLKYQTIVMSGATLREAVLSVQYMIRRAIKLAKQPGNDGIKSLAPFRRKRDRG